VPKLVPDCTGTLPMTGIGGTRRGSPKHETVLAVRGASIMSPLLRH
jgi:hypothetical protein